MGGEEAKLFSHVWIKSVTPGIFPQQGYGHIFDIFHSERLPNIRPAFFMWRMFLISIKGFLNFQSIIMRLGFVHWRRGEGIRREAGFNFFCFLLKLFSLEFFNFENKTKPEILRLEASELAFPPFIIRRRKKKASFLILSTTWTLPLYATLWLQKAQFSQFNFKLHPNFVLAFFLCKYVGKTKK